MGNEGGTAVHDDRSTTPGAPSPVETPEPPTQQVGLATITLRQIRVSRADVQDKPSSTDANPMNRLVPYLDLYARLSDEELARLAGVPAAVASNLRRQVVQVDRALARFTDLLPRLTDAELVRLTGATPKTIRFWRLCQPRVPMTGAEAQGWSVAQAAETLGRVQSSAELPRRTGSTGTFHAALGEEPPLDSGAPIGHASGHVARTATGEQVTASYRMPAERESGSSAYRMPTAERESGSSAYRMPTAERESGSSAYRMPTAEREAGRRSSDLTPPPGTPASRMPSGTMAPVDLSRPRTHRTEETPAAQSGVTVVAPPPVAPPLPIAPMPTAPPPAAARAPAVVQKQQAVSQQMTFSGDPFPGYDSEGSGPAAEDDGIFIGLELPDPRTLAQPGRRE